ncbi:MAG: hypothetical protein M3552_19570, partial [Planctomycetota bacterium]|nr:hypothetical protein [Planctomycetota bacterium]
MSNGRNINHGRMLSFEGDCWALASVGWTAAEVETFSRRSRVFSCKSDKIQSRSYSSDLGRAVENAGTEGRAQG